MKFKHIKLPLFLFVFIIFCSLFFGGYFSSGNQEYPYAKAVTYVGKCGENCKWTLNLKKGTLTLSGSGKTNNFEEKSTPWFKYVDDINRLIVSDGVTTLGDNIFAFLDKAETVTLPNSLKTINDKAFYGCASLKQIKGGYNALKKIGNSAFAYCRKLEAVPDFPSLEKIGEKAFYYCYGLSDISLGYSVKSVGKDAFAYCEGLNKIRIVNYRCEISDSENTFYKSAVTEGFNNSTAKEYCDKYERKFVRIKDINYLNDLTVKLEYSTVTYDGSKKKPAVKIKGLKEGRDYTVKYSANIDPGIAKVTVYAAGDTLGEKTATFKINPSAPENIKLKSRKSDSLTLKWDKVIGADKYEVVRLIKGEWVSVGKTSKTSFTDSGLSGASEYSFKVRALKLLKKDKCVGKYSKTFTGLTNPEVAAISKVALVRGGGKLRVTIKKINGVSGYELFMATKENGKYKNVYSVSQSGKMSVVIDGLSNSNIYYFKVRAYMISGKNKVYSAFSDVVSSNVL